MCPGRDRLRAFWESQSNSPQLQGHPIKQIRNWKERCIPLSFHGDGVPVVGVGKSWSKSMTMYSFSSVVGLGTTIQSMWLIWAVFKDVCSGGGLRDTRFVFYRRLCWSFAALYTGLWPERDWLGRLLKDRKLVISYHNVYYVWWVLFCYFFLESIRFKKGRVPKCTLSDLGQTFRTTHRTHSMQKWQANLWQALLAMASSAFCGKSKVI